MKGWNGSNNCNTRESVGWSNLVERFHFFSGKCAVFSPHEVGEIFKQRAVTCTPSAQTHLHLSLFT